MLAQTVPGHRHLAAGLVGIELDVVVIHRVGRVQADHGIGGEPAALDQAFEHALPIGVDPHGLWPDDVVFENGGKRSGQVPGLKERAPVDEAGQLAQIEVLEDAAPQKFWFRWRVVGPVNRGLVGARL